MFDEFKSAFQRPNNAHVQLIIINVAIFIAIGVISVICTWTSLTSFSDGLFDQFTIPPTIAEFLSRPWTLFTYMFAHDRLDFFHILFNMLVFYWSGSLFVEYLGSAKLTALYILGGLGGGILYLLMFNTVPYYIER